MSVPPKFANSIYVGFPICWCGALAFSSLDTVVVFLARWIALLVCPVLVCAAIYGVQRLRKRPLYWQRWFFWIGLLLPALVRLPHSAN